MSEGKITVNRTAHYHTAGEITSSTKGIWYVLHGYGQLAEYFIRKFIPLKESGHFIIAPEALSSYYTDGNSGRVGGSWMTKHHREDEIRDYITYLDKLHNTLRHELRYPSDVSVNILGFSQGVATAARWASFGDIKPDKLVLWSGSLPSAELPEGKRAFRTYFFHGNQDPYRERIDESVQRKLRALHFTPFEEDIFDGGHEVASNDLTEYSRRYNW